MSHKYLSFDIETAKVTPIGDNIHDHRPLGISCWAVAWKNERFGTLDTGLGYGVGMNEEKQPKMSVAECRSLVFYLQKALDKGYTLLTHNGAGFDFDILAEESGMVKECAELALNSVDTCFEALCRLGYPVGLNAAAKGFGLSGKTEGMSGLLAPQMWSEGRYEEVLEYVQQDVRTTLQVALAIEQQQQFKWVAKSGRLNTLPMPGLMTVKECILLPLPDTSWMSGERLTRDRFIAWMKQPDA